MFFFQKYYFFILWNWILYSNLSSVRLHTLWDKLYRYIDFFDEWLNLDISRTWVEWGRKICFKYRFVKNWLFYKAASFENLCQEASSFWEMPFIFCCQTSSLLCKDGLQKLLKTVITFLKGLLTWFINEIWMHLTSGRRWWSDDQNQYYVMQGTPTSAKSTVF